jgi:hypothetical protein
MIAAFGCCACLNFVATATGNGEFGAATGVFVGGDLNPATIGYARTAMWVAVM